jgi:hypothetical protein
MRPDQALLARDLAAPRVVAGIRAGKWRIIRHEFPDLVVSVSADTSEGRPAVCLTFRCQCDGYPGQAPYVELWDDATRTRPAPPGLTSPGVADALKDWGAYPEGGVYRAWQRAAATHNGWAALRPDEAWHPGRTILYVLSKLHELAVEEAACVALG